MKDGHLNGHFASRRRERGERNLEWNRGEFGEQGLLLPYNVGLAMNVLGVALSLIIIYGAVKMRNLENYGLAMTAAVVAMIPVVSPC